MARPKDLRVQRFEKGCNVLTYERTGSGIGDPISVFSACVTSLASSVAVHSDPAAALRQQIAELRDYTAKLEQHNDRLLYEILHTHSSSPQTASRVTDRLSAEASSADSRVHDRHTNSKKYSLQYLYTLKAPRPLMSDF
jgi:hypothetical protein